MELEIGKKYKTRDGEHIVLIEAETTLSPPYRMQGIDEKGRITWRTKKGRFGRYANHMDLVSEA